MTHNFSIDSDDAEPKAGRITTRAPHTRGDARTRHSDPAQKRPALAGMSRTVFATPMPVV